MLPAHWPRGGPGVVVANERHTGSHDRELVNEVKKDLEREGIKRPLAPWERKGL